MHIKFQKKHFLKIINAKSCIDNGRPKGIDARK